MDEQDETMFLLFYLFNVLPHQIEGETSRPLLERIIPNTYKLIVNRAAQAVSILFVYK